MPEVNANDLSADVAAAFDQVSEAPAVTSVPAAETPPAAAPDKAVEPAAGERARGDDGKFVAKPKDASPLANQPAVQQQPGTAQPNKFPAPTNWKGAGKVEWARLHNDLQKEIIEDYARFQKAQDEAGQWGSVITPERAQAFAAQYGSVHNGVKQLLALSDFATKQPAEFIRYYAQQNRIDLASLVGQAGAADGVQQPQPQVPPEWQRELTELRSTVQQMRQEAETRQKDTITSQIEAFKADPAHPYFNDVQRAVAGLLMSGEAKDLQDAYDQACWARPDIRQSMLADHKARELKQQADSVSAARKANGSLNGSPAGASVAKEEPDEDLESTVRRAFNSVNGAARV